MIVVSHVMATVASQIEASKKSTTTTNPAETSRYLQLNAKMNAAYQ